VSESGLPPLWSPAQQSWLQAMGYTVFVDGQIEDVAAAPITLSVAASAAPAERAAAQPAPASTGDAPAHAAPRPRRSAPTSIDAPPAAGSSTAGDTPAAPRERASGSGRRPAVRMPDRLQIALLRASGCNPAEPETQALMAGWNLDDLRGNAAAKRALWPHLRALRKRGRP
jgi:hypothetical protein